MQYDEIIDCPKTGGNLCYRVQVTPEISTYMSLSSGYMTNSLMKEGEEFFEIQMETLPELHKDIAWKDPNTGLTWIPNTINEKGIGIKGTSYDATLCHSYDSDSDVGTKVVIYKKYVNLLDKENYRVVVCGNKVVFRSLDTNTHLTVAVAITDED